MNATIGFTFGGLDLMMMFSNFLTS